MQYAAKWFSVVDFIFSERIQLVIQLPFNGFLHNVCMKVNIQHNLYLGLCFIREMNKKLYDSNDGLRSALASEAVASKRRVSPMFADDIFSHTNWSYIR